MKLKKSTSLISFKVHYLATGITQANCSLNERNSYKFSKQTKSFAQKGGGGCRRGGGGWGSGDGLCYPLKIRLTVKVIPSK